MTEEEIAQVRRDTLDEVWLAVHVQRFAARSHLANIPGVEPSNNDSFYAGIARAKSEIMRLRGAV